MSSLLVRKQFEQMIRLSNPTLDLAQAALCIAQEEYPELDPDEYLNALDTMAEEVKERLPEASYPLRIIQCINRYLYDDLGFSGNKTDYYNPENSYLNRVIDQRRGIPITLSLVYLEIARRIDFPMVGINMPGHFLIRPTAEEMDLFVDPFNQGEVLFREDCQERLSSLFSQNVEMQPHFFSPISPRLFLARILRNLKGIYLQQNDLERALASVDRMLLLVPDAIVDQRDRGLIYYQMGDWPEARHDLDHYLDCHPTAEDADIVHQILDQINSQFP